MSKHSDDIQVVLGALRDTRARLTEAERLLRAWLYFAPEDIEEQIRAFIEGASDGLAAEEAVNEGPVARFELKLGNQQPAKEPEGKRGSMEQTREV